MRTENLITWLSPDDCMPPHGLNLTPGSRDSEKVEGLHEAFCQNGFDTTEPALVGYPLGGKIQLLSGTHRHEAAKRTRADGYDFKLPVTIFLRRYAEAYWGSDQWPTMLADIAVDDLERGAYEPDCNPGLFTGIDINWRTK